VQYGRDTCITADTAVGRCGSEHREGGGGWITFVQGVPHRILGGGVSAVRVVITTDIPCLAIVLQ